MHTQNSQQSILSFSNENISSVKQKKNERKIIIKNYPSFLSVKRVKKKGIEVDLKTFIFSACQHHQKITSRYISVIKSHVLRGEKIYQTKKVFAIDFSSRSSVS